MTTLERKENTIFGYLQKNGIEKRYKTVQGKKIILTQPLKRISMLEQQIQTKIIKN